jgi:hypothetical protein
MSSSAPLARSGSRVVWGVPAVFEWGEVQAAGYGRSRSVGQDGKSRAAGGGSMRGGDRGCALSIVGDVPCGGVGRGSHAGTDGQRQGTKLVVTRRELMGCRGRWLEDRGMDCVEQGWANGPSWTWVWTHEDPCVSLEWCSFRKPGG